MYSGVRLYVELNLNRLFLKNLKNLNRLFLNRKEKMRGKREKVERIDDIP